MDITTWQGIALFLAGCLATGIPMVVRGDFLGTKAAEAAEERLNARIDRELGYIRGELGALRVLLEHHVSDRGKS